MHLWHLSYRHGQTLKARYGEERLVVIGQSIGTGVAAILAAHNHPKMSVLQAPYYAIEDWIHHLVPSLRMADNPFKFETYKRLYGNGQLS